MTKVNVADMHDKLAKAGIPVVTVRLTREQQIEVEFAPEATPEQKAAAQEVVYAYDQEAEDAAKAARSVPVTAADIDAAKTVADLKALLHRMQGAQ